MEIAQIVGETYVNSTKQNALGPGNGGACTCAREEQYDLQTGA